MNFSGTNDKAVASHRTPNRRYGVRQLAAAYLLPGLP